MSNVIIGTAGHVDHGKTSLIAALTGIDTDRLREEKERGITIELGFAYLTLPDGGRCGIIDVPGHEKFVRNMLAGAGSIDLALFVVAADEGMMPQSREHLEILSLLGVKRGIIAVTKTDTSEPDWLEMVIMDIRDEMKGTFLENAQIVPVSARTGEGIDTLKQCLTDMVIADVADSRDAAPCRLPVDRVFTKDGFGTVVTGTLTEGEIPVGAELTLFPSMKETRVRNLQVHSRSVQAVQSGQRVAINLSGVKTEEIQKGCVLAANGSMRNTDILDVRLDIVKSTQRKIETNSRLHLYHGTNDVTCKVVLLGSDELSAGQSCYAQLRTEEPISVRAGDRFVVRFYSPMETVGGGVVLDPNAPKRLRTADTAMFRIKEKGSLKERIACFILDRGKDFPPLKELKINPFLNAEGFDAEVKALEKEKQIFLVKDSAIHKAYLAALTEKCRAVLKEFHANNPLIEGMKKEELRSKLFVKEQQQYADEIISLMEKNGAIRLSGLNVADAAFEISMNEGQKRLSGEITQIILAGGFSTPSLDELGAKFVKEQKTFKQAMDALVAQGVLVVLAPQILIHRDYYNKALETAAAFNREFTLAEFRDALNTSRKYAVALLEYFDAKCLTKKRGEARVMIKKDA